MYKTDIDNNLTNNNNANDTINIRELLIKYLHRWYWFVLTVMMTFVLAFLYIRTSEIKHQIQALILLRADNTPSGASLLANMESFGFNNISKEVEDEIQIIGSKKIIRQAIDSLGIQAACFEKNGMRYVEKYRNIPLHLNLSKTFLDTLSFRIEFIVKEHGGKYNVVVKSRDRFKSKHKLKNIQEPFETQAGSFSFITTELPKKDAHYKIIVYPINRLVESYSQKLTVGTVNKQSNVIRLSIVEANIGKAEDFLNKIVVLYNLDAIIDKNIVAASTASFINERLGIITRELFDVESNVENYKRSNQFTDLSSEANIYLETANIYEKKITELETQLNLVNSVEGYIKDSKNKDALIPANVITEDIPLAKSIQDYNLAVLERMKLSQSANEKNPAIIQADQQIAALKANVLASISGVKSGITIALNDLLKQGTQFDSKIKDVPTKERQFLEIKRQQEIKQSLYLFLSQKREETALNLASTAPAARTIDRAYASLTPVAPKSKIIYLVALMLGLFIPFMFIYLKDLVNNKINDIKEFQRLIKAPYLGSISTSHETDRVVVQEGKTTPIAEMFKLVRTNLQFMIESSNKSSVILVTSSFTGEGKSFISINLAMSQALLKKKVVLIGLDIRNPMLNEYLHLPKSQGLTTYLSDETVKPEDIIVPSGHHDCFDVIQAGPIPPNPAELILNPRIDSLIRILKEKYHYIIIDTAPIDMVPDTYLLNRIADNSIFVVRQGYTPNDVVTLINKIYLENKLNKMGVILNGASPSSLKYSYGYGYGYKVKKNYSPPPMTFDEKLRKIYNSFSNKRKGRMR